MIKKLIISITIVLLCISVYSQYKSISLHSQKSSFSDYQLIEQINLSKDQDYYLSGEKIGLALNTYDATFQVPLKFSAIAYVELYTQDNQVVAQQKIRLEDGSGMGYIQIPKTLQTNYYYLRAYTNYMKNYGPAYFYSERIGIVNPFYPIAYQNEQRSRDTAISFHIKPEGDKLIPGRENNVYYYGYSHSGYCNEIVGRLVDNNDSVIVRSNSVKPIGSFSFVPVAGKSYRFEALVCDQKRTVELNQAGSSHHAILLDSLVNNQAYLSVISSQNELEIEVLNNGISYTSDEFENQSSQYNVALPQGINVVQLKSNTEVLATRLVAVPRINAIDISLVDNPVQMHERQSGKIQIKTTDKEGNPILSDLSVSVNLTSAFVNEYVGTNSEYSAYLGSLKRLFPETPQAEYLPLAGHFGWLQNYLAMHSSDTIEWHTIQFSDQYKAELKNDIISGTIINKSTGRPGIGKTVYQSFIDSIAWLNIDITDQQGQFLIEVEDEHAGDDIVFVMKDTTANYEIDLHNEFSAQFLPVENEIFRPNKALKDEIRQRMLNMQVSDAYHTELKTIETTRNNLRFYGEADYSYLFDDYIKLPTLEEFAYEVASGAVIQRENKNIHIYVVAPGVNRIIGRNPLYLIDGVPVLDKNLVALIPPEIMDEFHIVNSKYYYKTESFDGIIDLTSKKGDFSDFSMPDNSYRGSFVPVQTDFHNMVLDSASFHPNLPHYATTLYFNTSVRTDDNGMAEIDFTAADNDGTYSVMIIARNKKGEYGYAKYPAIIEVD